MKLKAKKKCKKIKDRMFHNGRWGYDDWLQYHKRKDR